MQFAGDLIHPSALRKTSIRIGRSKYTLHFTQEEGKLHHDRKRRDPWVLKRLFNIYLILLV